MKNHILVIGGTGYIGSEVVYQLKKNPDICVTSFSRHINENCTSFAGSMASLSDLENVFSQNSITITIILGGFKSIGDSQCVPLYANNEIVGLINILNTCVKYKCKKILFLSSSAVYESGSSISESDSISAKSFYAFIKHTSESLIRWYHKYQYLDYVILRCFNVCGINSLQEKSDDIISLSFARDSVEIYGHDFNTLDGTLIRDYVHVKDVGNAILQAINYEKSEIFNIGSGIGYSILEILKIIEESKVQKIEKFFSSRREYDQDCLVADITKAETELKWHPHYKLNDIIEEEKLYFDNKNDDKKNKEK